MARYRVLFDVREVQVDEDGNFVKEYKVLLPHEKEICKNLCESWNGLHETLLSVVNEDCFDRIESCRMKKAKPVNGITMLAIDFVAKKGQFITQKIKDAINDFVSAQMSDGWGEGDLGPINIMTGSDGTRFYAD